MRRSRPRKREGRIAPNVVRGLLDQAVRSPTPKFSGLGVIFYRRPMRLPVHALGSQKSFRPSLPIHGVTAIAETLRAISSVGSPWHDGFHLIDSRSLTLTHVSQFISPSRAALRKSRIGDRPIGARQLAAIAVSEYKAVDCVALVNARGTTQLYRDGRMLKG